jgi:antitoxin PrlF
MLVAKITSKGQVTIPKEVRERLGVNTGDELEFEETPRGMLVHRRAEPSPFHKYRGYLRRRSGKEPDALVEELRGR